MAQEIELKLALPAALHPDFRQSPILTRYQREQPDTKNLANRYFDTPNQALNRQAVALRIRHQGDRYIQTLKTRGESQGGLHQRHEWEWDLKKPVLDTGLFPPDALPDALDLGALAPAFSTDFQRTTWQLDYPFHGQSTHIELVLDSGQASTADRLDPISEIELELKSGPAEALFDLALELAIDFPLRITRISKAERGYRLHRPERPRSLPIEPTLPAGIGNRDAFLRLAAHYLERVQAAMESYEFLHDQTLLDEVDQALGQLLALLKRFRTAVCADDAIADLCSLQAELQRILQQPFTDTLATEAKNWLQARPLGLCLLQLSRLLICLQWRGGQALPADAPYRAP